MRSFARAAALALGALALAATAFAAGGPATPSADAGPTLAHATFAGGCFWCMETAFEGRPGVHAVISGYSGGHVKNPTYEQVSAGGTGHAESVDVIYDPSKTSYSRLLEIFWHNVDPLSANGQFCDRGNQYRSVIFYRTPREKSLALATREKVHERFHEPVATQVVPFVAFYRAEEYHQDFYKKNPVRYHEYREACGRDRRLRQLWGDQAGR